MTTNTKFWRYRYKGKSGCYWSTLFIDEAGAFAYVGDSGSGAYGHFSCDDIRKFVAYSLADAPEYPDYLAGKLCKGRRTEFNSSRTLARAKEEILTYRRQDSFTKEAARNAWNDLPLDETEYMWTEYLQDHREVFGDEWYELLQYDWDSWVISFIENSLPGLQELIKKELEEEACIKDQLVV
jgi:hypothetical protein